MGPKNIIVEKTLALIKPDAIHRAQEIEDLILNERFTILEKRQVHLTPEQASDFYAEHYGKMFFPSLIAFMSSGVIVALLLARDRAISVWRHLIGPNSPVAAREAAPKSIRALFGTDGQCNAVHGSESFSTAEKEIQFFFPENVMEPIPAGLAARDYLNRAVNPILLKGLGQLCKEKPEDPVIWLADWLTDNNPNRPKVIEPDS